MKQALWTGFSNRFRNGQLLHTTRFKTKHLAIGFKVAVCVLSIAMPIATAPAQVWFEEVAAATGVQTTFQPGPNLMMEMAHMMGGGAAGDFNNDGWTDLFVLSGGAVPDHLYINQGNGTFADETVAWGLSLPHMGAGAAVGDFNNDGWLDIYVTSFGPSTGSMIANGHMLYRNNGDNSFTDIAVSAGVNSNDVIPNGFSACFGDYDLDGDLDLFVAGWFTATAGSIGGNRLYRNNGNETFTDVTAAAGILELSVSGFTPRFADMNGDRFPEILIASDFGTSRYYRNNGDGTFTNNTVASGTGLDCNGMGATIGDYDNNGKFDWYVTDRDGSMGIPVLPCRNMLYLNQGNHLFVENSVSAGVNHGYWGWGAVTADIDHDGWSDLLEVNGFMDGISEQIWSNRPACVWLNNASGVFTEIALSCNFNHLGQGRGLLNFDYDNDGDQDFVVFSAPAPQEAITPLMLFRNDSITENGWLQVWLDPAGDSAKAPHGFGAKVRLTAGVSQQFRFIDGGSNYLSQSDLSASFGIGTATQIDEIQITWPDGQITTTGPIAANQIVSITPDGAVNPSFLRPPGDFDGNYVVEEGDRVILIDQFGLVDTDKLFNARADMNHSGVIDEPDFDLFNLILPPCPSDITPLGGNGTVNIDDLVAVLNAFGPGSGPADITPYAGGGLYGNGEVNIDDLVAILNAFGACP